MTEPRLSERKNGVFCFEVMLIILIDKILKELALNHH
jgi:hypothetical protein